MHTFPNYDSLLPDCVNITDGKAMTKGDFRHSHNSAFHRRS